MTNPMTKALACACLFTSTILLTGPAFAHAVCGDRIFPATLAIDDPGVGDELALPTVTYLPFNGNGAQETDASFSYTKTIFPHFGLSVSDGLTWQAPGGQGLTDLSIGAKYNFFCLPQNELMGSVGLNVDFGNTSTGGQGNTFNTYSPVLDIGKGFGDLPTSLNFLRPFAVTASLGTDIPGQSWTSGNQNSNNLNWGFTIQYSLPYYYSHIGQIDNAFFKRLIPITEFSYSKPISNYGPGTNVTTGTIQPGLIYEADTWQFALEAVVPINSASGKNVGVVGELHFFFDDIFPNTLGKPIFGDKS